ncbi:MAG TPA: hypothetical protein V6C84_24470 [Coleofasciculaceae cyanobacterium]|jgi:hypothetical protein
MKWIQGAALAALLVGQAAAQGPPADGPIPQRYDLDRTRPEDGLDQIPRNVTRLLEAAIHAGQLLAWADACRPSEGARAAVARARVEMSLEINRLPPRWRELAVGAMVATRMHIERLPQPCAVMGSVTLDGALRSLPMEAPR